jgi:hypothetical protein
MVRLSVFGSSLTTLALIVAQPVAAAPITLTGNVGQDFNPADKSANVWVIPGLSNPLDIGQPSWMTANGWNSGWAIKDIRTSYDPATDTLSVGVNTFTNSHGQATILGDAYGTGTEGTNPPGINPGGVNPPNFGGDKSFTLAFAPNGPQGSSSAGTPVFVVGIPADKKPADGQVGPGLDGFNAATYKNVNLGLEYNYGKTLTQNLGAVAFEPSAQHPGLEFTIPNFSKIPGLDTKNGFWISAYGGSARDGAVGEFSSALTRIPSPLPQGIPEPATVLAWTLVAGSAAWRLRRRPTAR